jgi:hypothetical protein
MTEESKIGFKLIKITTEEFAVFEDDFKESSTIEIKTDLQFGIEQSNRSLGVFPAFTFLNNGMPFIKIKVGCHFKVNEAGWDSYLDNSNKKIIFPTSLIQHLVFLSIGTTRGVLHCKTENTEFNKYFLPTININKLIYKDLEISLNE